MARAQVKLTCSECGATFIWERHCCHNRRAANEAEEWAASNIDLCPECYAKKCAAEREAKHQAEYEAAAKASAGLPALTGSERQIRWATTLRAEALDALRKMIDPVFWAAVEGVFAAETSAGWWIDHRGNAMNYMDAKQEAIIEATKDIKKEA